MRATTMCGEQTCSPTSVWSKMTGARLQAYMLGEVVGWTGWWEQLSEQS